MNKSSFLKALAITLLTSSVLSLAPMRPASAAMFVGTFDPPFGMAFSQLGFSGTATFEVADACLATTGFCTTAPINLTSATVTLYDLLNPANTDVLNFGAAQLINVYIQSGTLFGVNSPIVGPQFGVVSNGSVYSGNVYLQFELLSFGVEGIGNPFAYIFGCPIGNSECSADLAIRSNPARLRFGLVPEPGTLGLALAALAALGWRRRSIRHGL